MENPRQWLSVPPIRCDLCGTFIKDTFIDGKSKMGPWANFCPSCHKDLGSGFGTGRGQKYEKHIAESGSVEWIKTKG